MEISSCIDFFYYVLCFDSFLSLMKPATQKGLPFAPTLYIQIDMLTILKTAYYPPLHTFE